MEKLRQLYKAFRGYASKPRRVIRERFFDAIVETFAYHYGIEGANPPSDTGLDNLLHQLERRTLIEAQRIRDRLTVEGLKRLRDDRLDDALLEQLTKYDVCSPGELIRVLTNPDHEAYGAALKALGLQKKSGRPKKPAKGE